MALNNKRKAQTVLESSILRKSKSNTFEDAKELLNNTITQYPDRRIYQIEQWNTYFTSTFRIFIASSFDDVANTYIKDTETHANVLEYYFGSERTPLVLDIEWYNLIPTAHSILFDSINQCIDILIAFISVAITRDDGACISKDDICVEHSCSDDGRKASFHVKIRSLVFSNMACDMRSFVFYFCTWMYENRDDIISKIPEIFFYQTANAQKIIKEYKGSNIDEAMQQIKTVCEKEWQYGTHFQFSSCGIDTAIYSNGRAFRVAGVCKPNKENENPRFLKPCLITNWWDDKIDRKYLSEKILTMKVPPAECRRVWAHTSLLVLPSPCNANIKVPLPQGINWRVTDSEYTLLPPPSPQNVSKEWKWFLNTDRYIYPDTGRQMLFTGARANQFNAGGVMPMDIGGNANDDGHIYILDNDLVKYERRGGRWYNMTNNTVCVELDQIKREALCTSQDIFARYGNKWIEMHLAALDHARDSGYDDEDEYEEMDKRRKKYEDAKHISECISIRYLDEKAQGLMFTASNITIDPRFKLVTAKGNIVELGAIDRKTPVFCPKHEIDLQFQAHRSSAFVGLDQIGRRFLSCSRCGVGMSIKETWQEHATVHEQTWQELNELYGDTSVKFISKNYVTLEDLLRIPGDANGDTNDGNISEHSAYSMAHQSPEPKKYVLISNMGTGKTSVLENLSKNKISTVMAKLGMRGIEQPKILSISPRSGLALFTANQLGLKHYKDYDAMKNRHQRKYNDGKLLSNDELLCEQERLSICINSLKILKDRIHKYDVVIMDEFATTSLSMISKLMLPRVTETMKVLESLVLESKIVIMLAADGTPRMLKTLLPFVDWEDPAKLYVTVNTGGSGGISKHELYMSDNLEEVCQVLKKYVQEGKSVYIPTNQKQFADRLQIFCRDCLGLDDEQIMFYHKDSPIQLKKEIIEEPERRLGYTQDSPYPKVKVFITTPAFGVGFSVKGGLFDITIAFFFTYPLTVPGNIQHLARVRGNTDNTIICYYQTRLAKHDMYSPYSSHVFSHLEKAVGSYADLLENINCDGFFRIPEGQLRDFAIKCEVQDRLSEWLAFIMFVYTVASSTRTTPHMLMSWICNKGLGPIKTLPELNEDEMDVISSNSNPDIDTADAPRTWPVMRELWILQAYGKDLTENEVVYIKSFEEMTVPFGLLDEHEQCGSFFTRLDHIWRVMEVVSYGSGTRLLELDFKKYTRSQGVSMVSRGARDYQQYLLFEAWSRLFLPCIPKEHRQSTTTDAGVEVFLYIINLWRTKNIGGDLLFEVTPEVGDIKDAVEGISDLLKDLREKDAYVDDWINPDDMKSMNNLLKTGVNIMHRYASLVRKGLRQFMGMTSAGATLKRGRSLCIRIDGLERLILLASIRRINIECDVIINVSIDKFSALSKYRDCLPLMGLIPSDENIARACGMEL